MALQVRDIRGVYDDVISKITNILIILSKTWDYQVQNMFNSNYEKINPKLIGFSEAIELYANELENTFNILTQTLVPDISEYQSLGADIPIELLQ